MKTGLCVGASLCDLLMPSCFGGRGEPEVSMGCFLSGCTGSHFLDDEVMARIRGASASAWCKPELIPGSVLVVTLPGGRVMAPGVETGILIDVGLTLEQWQLPS